MTRIKSAITAGIVVLCSWSSASADFIDDFNRPDSSNMGPNWTEQVGDFRIESGRARSSTDSNSELMTVNPFSSANPRVSMDVAYGGSSRVTYAAIVSLYNDLANNIFVKVQDNIGNGTFNRVFFYYGNNSFNPWPGMTGGDFFEDVAPFQQARIETTVANSIVTLTIDRDFDGVPETTHTRGGIPAVGLGTAIGVGGFSNASLDNFFAGNVPEPTSVMLVTIGLSGAMLCVRRRS